MAYLLGYIATDGNISNSRVLKFGLKAEDKELLEKIKAELNFTGNIYPKQVYLKATQKTYYSYTMNIYYKEIVKDLKQLGISENKSLILGNFDFVPEEYQLSFLLGVFDGDGSIGRIGGDRAKNNVQIRLRFFSGAYEFMQSIKSIMEKNGYSKVEIRKDQRKAPFYSLLYSTKDSIKFFNEAYQNVSIFLNRKYKTYEELINLRKQYEQSKENKNRLKIKNTV